LIPHGFPQPQGAAFLLLLSDTGAGTAPRITKEVLRVENKQLVAWINYFLQHGASSTKVVDAEADD
jgi:hypothetical protein